jgi:glyceraldehyde 3-phosphate dehydrogenase
VPTPCVSCAFLDIFFDKPIDKQKINDWLASLRKDIFYVNKDLLVSKDYLGENHSSIIDLNRLVVDNNRLKLMAWYDNEAGYCSRVIDVIGLSE